MTAVWILCRVFAAWVVASIIAAAAHHAAKRACQARQRRAVMPAVVIKLPASTCAGGECFAWDPQGDRPVPVWCERHCPDCRTTPDGSKVPCFIHDYAFAAHWERRYGQ